LGKITKSIEIEASPEKVFAFVTDIKKMNEITGILRR
jgi:carbon monoxide dehydrogenase subunit G